MNAMFKNTFPRRRIPEGAGALIVGFTLGEFDDCAAAMEIGPYGPPEDQVDSWIAIGEDGAPLCHRAAANWVRAVRPA
jgi:hypothetical protein